MAHNRPVNNVISLSAYRARRMADRSQLWLALAMVAAVALAFAGLQAGGGLVARAAMVDQSVTAPGMKAEDRHAARFTLCHRGGGTNCIVDGDTFWFGGQKIRIADIDTPETHRPRCPAERTRGEAATRRLHSLLNAGPFTLAAPGRDADRYGRALRIVTRDGNSLGGVLVDEGLARPYDGGRRPWC